jgi:hypothetical protein
MHQTRIKEYMYTVVYKSLLSLSSILSAAENKLLIPELLTFDLSTLDAVTFLADPGHAGKPLRVVRRG